MASSSISSYPMSTSTLGSSPLHRLASFLDKACKHVGTISLPKGTLDTIKKYREEWSQHSGREVDAIVRALEPNSTNLCKRLDTMALVILCSILVHTEPCLAQQRGLCLLAETLYGGESTASQAVAERQGKKIATGQQALIPLVKGFIKSENSVPTRRWFGVLALELLKDCEQNIALLQDDTPTLQSLNGVIEDGGCQVLKLLAGSIIHTMLCAGVMPDSVWPSETDMELYAQFPRAQHYDTQWINAFEGFVEGLGLKSALAQERSCVIFAFALLVGQNRHITNDESAILVTVSEDLNIVIPNSAKGPATYINVPLDHIDSAIIESRANSQSQTPSHILVMKLSNDDGTTCYFNASKNNSNPIALVFAMENDAKTLMRLIQLKTFDGKKARHYSQSEAIDVSQNFPDNNSEGELAVQSPRKSQELRIMATQAASFLSRSPAARTSHSTLGVVSTISQRPVSNGRPDQQSTNAAQYVERSMSVAMGVDVSQLSPQSNTQTDARSSRGPVGGDIGNQRKLRTFDRTIGTGLSSSLRWKKANDINEDAPESRNPDVKVAEQQAAKFSSRDEHAQDYDSTYEVSPKNQKSRPGPVQLKSLPPQLLPSSNGNVDDHRHTDPGLNSEAQETPAISPGATAASRPQQSRKSKFPIILPNAGDGPTHNASSTKLSRRLRNIEGGLGNDVGPLVDPESHPSVETGAQEKTKLQNIPKRKATVTTKTQAGIQKQTKPAKKPAVKKGKIKAHADRLSDKGDEFDLEASPGPTGTVRDSANAPNKMHVRSQAQSPRGQYKNAEISVARSGPKASYLGSKAPPKAKASKARPQKEDEPEEKLIWELPRLASNEPHKDTQHKGAKQANIQSLSAPQERKASRPPAKPKPRSKPRSQPAPAAPMQPRFRRAAAIKANKRIQGLEDGDEITDVDDPRIKAPTNKSSAAAEKTGNPSVVTARINGKLVVDESTAHASPVPQTRAQRPKFAEVAKNDIKIDATDCTQRNPALESEVDTSSPEEIELVQESLVPPSNLTHKNTKTNEPLDHTDPAVPPIQTATVQEDLPTQGSKRCANDDTAHRHIQERDAQPKPPLVPNDVRKVADEIPDTEESIASDIISEHYLVHEKVGMIGDIEDSHFQEAMPEIEGRSFHSDQAQESLDIAADTLYSNKLTSVGTPLRNKHGGKIGVDSRDNQNQAEDPFKTKLGPLVPRASVSTDQHLAAQSLDITQMLKGQKTLQAKPIDEIQDKPVKQLRKTKEITEAAKALPINAEAQHVRLPQSVALPKNDLSGPAPGEKRSVDDDYRFHGKVVKVRTDASTDVHAKANGSKQATKTETPVPVVSLKPGLISWTVSGPRNQGTISAKKPRLPKKIHAIKPVEGTPVVESNDKARIAPSLDDPASWQYDQHAQRQLRAHMTPRHDPKHVPPMRPKLDVSIIHERAHRISSQSTKVDENGSPMPFIDQSRQVAQHGATPGDLPFAFDDDEIPATEDVHNTHAPQLPNTMKNMVLGMNDLAFASISSNRKQIPSSPHAASTHATIPPHVILHSGELVNERTLESIVPTLPQDPFVGGNPRPPSSFMNLLHKSAAEEKRRKSGDLNKEKLSAMVKRKPSIEEDDPDTTLVEPEPKRQKKHHYIVPESSSTSDPTSRAKTPAEDWSDQESDSTTMQWQKSLEPHQSNMLEILSHITHRLVRHLVGKETAAKDIVDDYEKGGNLLLQGYDKGRRQDLETEIANLELSKRRFVVMYTQIQTNVRKTSKDMSKRSMRALGAHVAQWHHQQQGVQGAIDKALAACVER